MIYDSLRGSTPLSNRPPRRPLPPKPGPVAPPMTTETENQRRPEKSPPPSQPLIAPSAYGAPITTYQENQLWLERNFPPKSAPAPMSTSALGFSVTTYQQQQYWIERNLPPTGSTWGAAGRIR
jgi:hypothetical protein